MHQSPREAASGARLGWFAAWLVAGPYAILGGWYARQVGLGYDSHAYWSAVQHMDHLYGASALSRDAYLYSPLFAQAVWPLGHLPWPAFAVIWALLQATAFVWLLRPLSARWFVPAMVAPLLVSCFSRPARCWAWRYGPLLVGWIASTRATSLRGSLTPTPPGRRER